MNIDGAENPMLAATLKDMSTLRFPVMASPKLDGIRARIIDGVVMSRSNKPIPNKWVQKLFGLKKFNGLDGELILGDPTAPDVYRRTDSAVMSIDGRPNITFWVFDDFTLPGAPFTYRYGTAMSRVAQSKRADIRLVSHIKIYVSDHLDLEEAQWLQDGYEGTMLRDPDGKYKSGRSTPAQQGLLKLKRFEDGEARILDFEEEMHNTNEAKISRTGGLERSSHKAGKVGKATLGALMVEDLATGVQFKIGTGFSRADREDIWMNRGRLRGTIVKYRFFAGGVKDKPRFPVYHGFRNKIDL